MIASTKARLLSTFQPRGKINFLLSLARLSFPARHIGRMEESTRPKDEEPRNHGPGERPAAATAAAASVSPAAGPMMPPGFGTRPQHRQVIVTADSGIIVMSVN